MSTLEEPPQRVKNGCVVIYEGKEGGRGGERRGVERKEGERGRGAEGRRGEAIGGKGRR